MGPVSPRDFLIFNTLTGFTVSYWSNFHKLSYHGKSFCFHIFRFINIKMCNTYLVFIAIMVPISLWSLFYCKLTIYICICLWAIQCDDLSIIYYENEIVKPRKLTFPSVQISCIFHDENTWNLLSVILKCVTHYYHFVHHAVPCEFYLFLSSEALCTLTIIFPISSTPKTLVAVILVSVSVSSVDLDFANK